MNHYLQGIPGSQTLPTETCLVLPRSEPSYMSQIIRCGGLSTKSLTLSVMTGAKNGKPGDAAEACVRMMGISNGKQRDAALYPLLP